MSAVEAKALADTLADTVAGTKGRTPCNTLAHIKAEVLTNTLANTLVQAESDTLRQKHLSTWWLTLYQMRRPRQLTTHWSMCRPKQ